MRTASRLLFLGLFLFACCSNSNGGSSRVAGSTLPADLQGVWQGDQSADVIRVEPTRIVEFDGHGLIVRGFVGRNGDKLILRRTGLKEDWRASVHGSVLRLEHGGKTSVYRRLDQLPPQVDLAPLPVADSHPLPPSKIQEIQREIARRFEDEQNQLKDPTRGDGNELRQDNLSYLRGRLAEVGWIDSDRFGQRTSVYTVLLAKHTEDLRLMLTILPFASTELKKSGKGQTYAILYDAVQLGLGRKQLYGTQVTEDEKGHPYVLPLEDPENVDKHLADLRLPPLKQYMAQVGMHLYNGQPVRLADDH